MIIFIALTFVVSASLALWLFWSLVMTVGSLCERVRKLELKQEARNG